MPNQVHSSDGVAISYEISGKGLETLVFVHGWLGNIAWWEQQEAEFRNDYQIIRIDLGGHGRSGQNRVRWSVDQYADDITAVLKSLRLSNFHLIGHSMSGSNVISAAISLEASEAVGLVKAVKPAIRSIILIDTLHDLDAMPDSKVMEPMFVDLRSNFSGFIDTALNQFLLVPDSPKSVRDRLRREMLSVVPQHAEETLIPFYATDIRPYASQLVAPVRAINSTLQPTHSSNNRKYFKNFDHKIIPGVGHYPMLEAPEKFNKLLKQWL